MFFSAEDSPRVRLVHYKSVLWTGPMVITIGVDNVRWMGYRMRLKGM